MAEPAIGPSRVGRRLRIFGLSVAIVFLAGIGAGFLVAHMEDGGGFGATPLLILGGLALAIIECGWLIVRQARAPTVTHEPGPGEAAERVSQKKWTNLLTWSGVVGGITGAAIVLTTRGDDGLFETALPIWVAIALVAGWLALMAYATYYYLTQVDELELNANYFGYAVGGGLTVLVYPVWYLLWWAGAVPEPMHEVLMGLLLIGATAGYLWKKYR